MAEQCEGQGGISCSTPPPEQQRGKNCNILYFLSVPELTAESKKLLRNHLKICSALEYWEYPFGGSCAAEYL